MNSPPTALRHDRLDDYPRPAEPGNRRLISRLMSDQSSKRLVGTACVQPDGLPTARLCSVYGHRCGGSNELPALIDRRAPKIIFGRGLAIARTIVVDLEAQGLGCGLAAA